MEDWQIKYNALFNDLAVKSYDNKIKCKNCGCAFYEHRYWYRKDKEHTQCHCCEDCTWFEPFGLSLEQLFPVKEITN